MARSWLSVRMPAPITISPTIPDAVEYLRSADPNGLWSFERIGADLGLWFHTTADVLTALRDRLPGQADPLARPSAADNLTDEAIGLATELSMASSDFALRMIGSRELPPAVRLGTAVRHLAFVVDLLPAGHRTAFLFHCWQHWTRRLTPFDRIELSATAPVIACENADEGEWDDYRQAVRNIIESQREPAAYLLFDHAHLTHNRLGIDDRTEALAALVVRTALVVRRSITAPEHELQTV